MHDGLGHLIGDGFADDVEVGGYEAADKFGFEGFAFGELGVLFLVEGEGWGLLPKSEKGGEL